MKATGEVMGIGTTFEEALLKAVQSLELDTKMQTTLLPKTTPTESELTEALEHPTDVRLFYLFEALRQGWSKQKIQAHTQITMFFLNKLAHIFNTLTGLQTGQLTVAKAHAANQLGFTAGMIAQAAGVSDSVVNALLPAPVYKMVDTCAGEFASETLISTPQPSLVKTSLSL